MTARTRRLPDLAAADLSQHHDAAVSPARFMKDLETTGSSSATLSRLACGAPRQIACFLDLVSDPQ
jgi:hypothetical protein